jgi:3-hydroxybutyryl-CoA dehydratase
MTSTIGESMNQEPPTFDSLEIGQKLTGRMTVTEAHVVLAAGIFGDFAPLHVDAEYAKTTRFGERIAHGTLITGIMAGVLSKGLGKNALGYLEQNVRFLAPVFFGDTVATEWEVTEKIPKEKLGGGIVKLTCECASDRGTVVVAGESALIVGNGP